MTKWFRYLGENPVPYFLRSRNYFNKFSRYGCYVGAVDNLESKEPVYIANLIYDKNIVFCFEI